MGMSCIRWKIRASGREATMARSTRRNARFASQRIQRRRGWIGRPEMLSPLTTWRAGAPVRKNIMPTDQATMYSVVVTSFARRRRGRSAATWSRRPMPLRDCSLIV